MFNNRIRAREIRVIDEDGKNLGVLTLPEALQRARERGLDLIQVTHKLETPVCKIMDRGKYLYALKKKERKAHQAQKGGELKGIRLRFNISPHDLETRVNAAEKFLKEGKPIKVEMVLRGRERALRDFARQKVEQFLDLLKGRIPIKVERELKREARGFTMIISKQ